MSKKEKFLVFTNVITLIGLLILGGVLVLSKDKKEVKNDDTSKCVEVDDTTKEEVMPEDNCIKPAKVDGYLVYSDGSEDNKIYSMNDKTLKVISTELGEKVIVENVNKTYDIYAGMSDVCEGNRWIIASTEDNKFIAVSVDAMVCGSKIKTIDVSAELTKKKLNDTVSIYNTKTFTNQYEPQKYEVYAINEDGKSTVITDIFE